MRSMERRTFPLISTAAACAAVCIAGWVVKATLAQPPAEKTELPANTEPAPTLPATPADLDVPKVAAPSPSPPPIVPQLPTQAIPETQPRSSVPLPAPTVVSGHRADNDPFARSEPQPVYPSPSIPHDESSDPERAVAAFVAQNQKLAESQLAVLRAEEAKLRARLKKVEAGIKRWQAVADALKQSQGVVTVSSVPGNPTGWKGASPPGANTEFPQDLDRVPQLREPASPFDERPQNPGTNPPPSKPTESPKR